MTAPTRLTAEEGPMNGCICETKSRWWFYHLTYCPWRKRVWGDR
jgi:hypothetical protein